MGTDLREFLSKHGLRDDVIEEAVEMAAPEFYRSEIAKVGAKAKKADELENELTSIRSAPKRKEALKRVGIDYDAVPKYGQDTLDSLPHDKLDDLDFVADFVKQKGFEAKVQSEEQTRERTGAEQVAEFASTAGQGPPPEPAGYAEAVAKAETPEELNKVYADFGKPIPE